MHTFMLRVIVDSDWTMMDSDWKNLLGVEAGCPTGSHSYSQRDTNHHSRAC